jgi:hypothetical protein
MNKKEIMEKLTELGIAHDPEAKVADLKALLPKETKETDASGFIVGDPQVLRPVELPLVVKMPEGQSWANPQQEEYSKTLNAYAYQNSNKWAKKKGVLLARLKELAENPEKLQVFKGEPDLEDGGKVSYKNKLIEK